MDKHQAKGATAVVLDAYREILALANVPTFDPNKRETFQGAKLRNQAITDTFEPGSIMKPFTAALALDLGRIAPNTLFETGRPFRLSGQHHQRRQPQRHAGRGRRVAQVQQHRHDPDLRELESREMWNRFTELGLGQARRSAFPARRPDACVPGSAGA